MILNDQDAIVKVMDNIQIIRSNRRTISVEIRPNLQVLVRTPLGMRDGDIWRFLGEKWAWIEKHLQTMRKSGEDHHLSSKNQVGFLFRERQSERQLPADTLPGEGARVCGGV